MKFTLAKITKEFVESNPTLRNYSVATIKKAYKQIKSMVGDDIYKFNKKQFVAYFKSIKILFLTKKQAENLKKEEKEKPKEPIGPIEPDADIYVPSYDYEKERYPYRGWKKLSELIYEELKNYPIDSFEIDIYTQQSDSPFQTIKVKGFISNKSYEHWENIVDCIDTAEFNSKQTPGSEVEVGSLADVVNNAPRLLYRAVMRFVAGGCSKQHMDMKKPVKIGIYSCMMYSPKSYDNNCGISCLNYIIDEHIKSGLCKRLNYKNEKSKLNLDVTAKLKPTEVLSIYSKLKEDLNLQKDLFIIDENYGEDLDLESNHYFFLDEQHYRVIKSYSIVEKKQKTKRGYLFWDCETRENEEKKYLTTIAGKSVLVNRIDDTITHVYYKKYKSDAWEKENFVTKYGGKSSVRQFVEFLIAEQREGRSYNCFAHNGSRFDMFLFMASLTKDEKLKSSVILRGLGIIKFELFNCEFKDTCCFLTASLDELCEDFKIEQRKLTKIEYDGKVYTNTELCFYKPELTFKQFLSLEQEEPIYWELYNNYCLYDCISLSEIWTKFTNVINSLIESMNKELLKKCDVNRALTIGSFAKSLLIESNKLGNKSLYDDVKLFCDTQEKYNFLNKSYNGVSTHFKRGGISHCNKAGLHNECIVGYDIKSQYPASMVNMNIAIGESYFTDKFNSNEFGFYHIKNIKFNSTYSLKPVSTIKLSGVLEWNTSNEVSEGFFDTDMIKYLVNHYNMTFEVEKGLVTKTFTEGKNFFGDFIFKFFDEKAKQDDEKEKQENGLDNNYNPALRSAIKLVINSVSGKLVEDIDYKSVKWCNDEDAKKIGGVAFELEKRESKAKNPEPTFNWLLPLGIMVYSYSKRLLFDYIHCLPNKSDDIVHIETDGMYFSKSCEGKFLRNLDLMFNPLVCVGKELGNVEKDCETVGPSYWLGKKFYQYDKMKFDKKTKKEKQVNIMRIKGVPLTSIDDKGSKIDVVTKQTYVDVYSGKTFKAGFKTLKKDLYGEEIKILSFNMFRDIKPNMEYSVYN